MLTRALEGEGISEGEKDTDRLVSLGLRATSSPNGAKAWKDEYADQVKAAGVSEMILWPHQDAEGARYTADVAASYLRRKIRVKVVALPGLPEHGDISDWLDLGHPLEELLALVDATPWLVERPADTDPGDRDYLEPLAAFLAEEDPPLEVIFPTILPRGTLMLLHGDARARKSLAAFEFALSAATGTAPFGLARFRPDTPVPVLYIQEEDSRSLTRPRLRRLVRERCGRNVPDALCVSVRRGVDLDDPVWVARLIADLQRLNIRLLVLDAARRLSIKTG
jgi:putative DNA primase/helicase